MGIPLIGMTTYRYKNKHGYAQQAASQAYTDAVIEAGGCPVMIPLGLSESALDEALGRLDGLLFTGGGDIRPEIYNSPTHPLVAEADSDRDRIELHLVRGAMERGLPFFGICRGLQLINVALGGSLYEDILEQHPKGMQHQYFPGNPRDYLAHTVRVESGSRLADILGADNSEVNSLHHQGIRRLAPGLQPTAYAPDGIIEAIEVKEYPFGLAVQWHPENLQMHPPMRALFETFSAAAKAYREK
jgi:putative glutamine amidotransferase